MITTSTVASIRRGILAARTDATTFYGFYTGEHSLELFDDFLNEMPKLLFEDGDEVAIYAFKRRIVRYVARMEVILADTSATN